MNASQSPLAGRPLHYGFLLLAAAFLYFDVFVPPATPIYLNVDHLLNLHDATRMLDGQMIYRDFFQITPPGTELVYFALFRLFGVRAWIPNALLVLLGLSLAWLCVFISRKVLSGPTAYLPCLMFLLVAFHSDLDATHHWHSVLAVTAAMALVMEKRSPKRLAGAAALCALASFFTLDRGVGALVGLGVFLWWEHRRKLRGSEALLRSEGLLAGVFSIVTLALNLYFVGAVGLKRLWWCTVIFGLKYYSTDSLSNSFQAYTAFMPTVTHWTDLPPLLLWVFIHTLVPLVYLVFIVQCLRRSEKDPDQPWDRLMLLALMGLFLFAGMARAPSYGRLCKTALPGLILFIWFLSSPGRLRLLARQIIWLGAAVMLTRFALHRQTTEWTFFDAPVGRVAFFDPKACNKYEWLRSHTRPSELVFDSAGEVYFLLGLRSPAQVQFLTSTDYTRPEQAQDVIENLERQQVSMVLWNPQLDPGVRGSQPGDHLGPLRDYLQAHYHQVKVFEDARILERDDAPAMERTSGDARALERSDVRQ